MAPRSTSRTSRFRSVPTRGRCIASTTTANRWGDNRSEAMNARPSLAFRPRQVQCSAAESRKRFRPPATVAKSALYKETTMPIRATVWGENVHEQKNKAVAENYPKGMHGQIAALLGEDSNIKASTVTLQDPEHGMTEAKLDETDVLVWWGHAAHGLGDDAVVERIAARVMDDEAHA